MKRFWRILLWSGAVIAAVSIALSVLLAYAYLRPNRAVVVSEIVLETWPAVADGKHNSNTDMIWWHDNFLLVHESSEFHFGTEKSRIYVLQSADGKKWEKLSVLSAPGEDLRDPKFAPIGDKLLLYALQNKDFNPEPYKTVYSSSTNGRDWAPFADVGQKGWLFWRAKTNDGKTWYLPAYWYEHGKAALFKTTNGVQWDLVGSINEGDRNDETDIAFLPDGGMIATSRLEFSEAIYGDSRGSTLIATAPPPYDKWTPHVKDKTTRLDGPNLFSFQGRVFAVGRYQPSRKGPFNLQGSIFARKRTSLFEVRADELVWLCDLPSAGDTSYAGLVIKDNQAFICYYTSDIHRDWPWIMGMLMPSEIRMARVDLKALARLADKKNVKRESPK